MNKFKQCALVLALSCSSMVAQAQQPVAKDQGQVQVQDGITVKKLSVFRHLAPEQMIEKQASQQYSGLMSQAQAKGALAPEGNPQLIRLRGIAKRIIPHAVRWNPAAAKWNWQVNLLGSKEVNAFCMPGGRIAFFTGILDQLKLTDDEVAAIMGHEIAHALREHGREQMGKTMGTSVAARVGGALLGSYLGIDPRITDTAAQYGTQMLALKYSRDDEREADLIGLDLAARAGFDPRSGVALWDKMGQLSKRQPISLLSTHPGGRERIDIINQHLPVLLPVYANAKGTTVARLPPYRTVALR
jgi:Zn-dependent protease with chaperone function